MEYKRSWSEKIKQARCRMQLAEYFRKEGLQKNKENDGPELIRFCLGHKDEWLQIYVREKWPDKNVLSGKDWMIICRLEENSDKEMKVGRKFSGNW